jgi:DNA polymerase elongation subunit (family B)
LNNEGIQYSEPKLKMMGIEAIRSSTPQSCRDSIKEALKIILEKTENDSIEYIQNFKKIFKKLSYDEIAFPRGVNGIDKYFDRDTIYRKATPIHVRGALLFNHKLKEMKLENKYSLIFDKEKIKFCYLKLPNPLHENVISCSSVLPKEFGLEEYIDYDLQFEKAFLEPIKNILDTIGWKTEKTNKLNAFFK